MVMMGIEFTGTVPFSNVYLHGLIRDSQVSIRSKKSAIRNFVSLILMSLLLLNYLLLN